MPPANAPRGHSRLPHRLALIALLASATPVAGQEIPLIRDYPGEGPYQCPIFAPPPNPSEDELMRAGQLSSDAQQQVILGNLQQAEGLYQDAADVNPSSPLIAYLHGRALQDLERYEEAMFQYCRSLALGAEDEGIEDARSLIDQMYDIVRERIPEVARNAFAAGLLQSDSAFYDGAESSFSVAMREAPAWPAPVFNRAVINERLGRIPQSLADFRRFLDLTPSDVDPLVVLVSERIGQLEGAAAVTTPSPTGALALGVLPGMGHYYSGRPLGGTIILGLAGGAIAAGVMYRNVTVLCLYTPPAGEACPSADVVDELVERPLMAPGIGIAAAITIVGAIDALSKARARRAEAEEITGEVFGAGPRLRAPSLTTDGRTVDLNLLRVTFR